MFDKNTFKLYIAKEVMDDKYYIALYIIHYDKEGVPSDVHEEGVALFSTL